MRVGKLGFPEPQLWWEEFFEIERNIFTDGHTPRFLLVLKETGRIAAVGDSLMELNKLAIIQLNNIFEETVLHD